MAKQQLILMYNSRVDSRGIPLNTIRNGVEASGGILQILFFPDDACVGSTSGHRKIGIVALEITCQRIVEVWLFDDHLQSGVVCPLQAEKTGHEIFSTLQHSILCCGTRNDLSAGVVEMTIVIVMQHA